LWRGEVVTKGRAFFWLAAVLAAGGAIASGMFAKPEDVAKRFLPGQWFGNGRAATQGPRSIAVGIATAIKKKTPVIIEELDKVTTMASVAVKPRLDSVISGVHFTDGAYVKQGDLLVTLDSRALEAQIAQSEGNLARDRAQLAGAERDLRRYSELAAKCATPQTNVDDAKTQVDMFAAAIKADLAALENLKIQLSYCSIGAPISGKISQAAVDVGNVVRSADNVPVATLNQMAPVYVTFAVSQRNLPGVRGALAEGFGSVEAIVPGETRRASGRIAMIENTVDPTTGMVLVRAEMPNDDELLWPGTLVDLKATIRIEEAVVVPSAAVQISQRARFVFVVRDNIVTVTPVSVARSAGAETVIESGLADGDVVVTDGQLQLIDGATVTVRERKAGV
jgi:multidrug efflux system membrane fusion protein